MKKLFFLGLLLVTAVTTFSQMQQINESKIPVRALRSFGISANMGWNSLTGVGFTFQSYATEHIGFEYGLGLSAEGYKFSGRLRYLFLEKNLSPLVAAGFIYGTGFSDTEFESDFDGNNVTYTIGPSPFLQLSGGIDYVAPQGFFIMASLGYAILLKENIEYTHGIPSADTKQINRIAFQSGMAVEVSIGYIFAKKKVSKK